MSLLLWTASRTIDRPELVAPILREAARYLGQPVTLLHGGASGGDHWADVVWRAWGLPADVMPADWSAPCIWTCRRNHRKHRRDGSTYCPAAGMYRNERMVRTAPDLCVAAIVAASSGASGCADLAEAAGIETWRREVVL